MIKMIVFPGYFALAIRTCQTALNEVRVNATAVKCSNQNIDWKLIQWSIVTIDSTHVLFLLFCLIVRYT